MSQQPRMLEIAILAAGIVMSAAAGVYGYRVVGLYGDGPFASGYHRERDAETGTSLLVHETVTSQGRIWRVLDQRLHLREVRLDADGDGIAEAKARPGDTNIAAGFSLTGDGVIDAWAFRTPSGQLVRVEVSTRQNGKIDRWEHYRDNRMVKVDLDTDGNGHPDRWQTFEDGILIDTFIDANEDGRPDAPPVR